MKNNFAISTDKSQKEVLLGEIKNKNIWWAALAFASFTFAFFSFNTWITTYLTETTSMSLRLSLLFQVSLHCLR